METYRPSRLQTVLRICVAPEKLGRFLRLFTGGVSLSVQIGGTLEELICGQLGVSEDYLENRIQTIFLNFKAVDAPEKAVVNEGAVVTLSAAMPGLVGATMRKGGTLAGFRSGISCAQGEECREPARGWITLKLLNMVARELGPTLLAAGVYVEGPRIESFLKEIALELAIENSELQVNDSLVPLERVIDLKLPYEVVHLVVDTQR